MLQHLMYIHIFVMKLELMKIEEELQQKKFKNEFHKVHLNVVLTATKFTQKTNGLLKPFNISWQQFNILRILKGKHPEPATVKELTEKMIDKMSNSSRLVEKLVQKGLVERQSCSKDRRRVDIVITRAGMTLVNNASEALDQEFEENNMPLTKKEAIQLNNLLDKIRG